MSLCSFGARDCCVQMFLARGATSTRLRRNATASESADERAIAAPEGAGFSIEWQDGRKPRRRVRNSVALGQQDVHDGRVPPLHTDEINIDSQAVSSLVAMSMPEFAGLPVTRLESSGSTNALFRLGHDKLVRLPRQPGGSAAIEKEARWLPMVSAGLSVPVPKVIAVGDPDLGYPERWLVTSWLDGNLPAVPPTADSRYTQNLAADLGVTLTQLRSLATSPETLSDPRLTGYRGGPLADLVEDFEDVIEACRAINGLNLDLERVRRTWNDALEAEHLLPQRQHWYHGDLLAENLLVSDDGRLAGVLDFGGLAIGDPSVDLVAAWEVLDAEGRQVLREVINVSDAEWRKGMGWALFIALITFPYYWNTMPKRCADRLAMAQAVLSEA